jgi:hypothetical protein
MQVAPQKRFNRFFCGINNMFVKSCTFAGKILNKRELSGETVVKSGRFSKKSFNKII